MGIDWTNIYAYSEELGLDFDVAQITTMDQLDIHILLLLMDLFPEIKEDAKLGQLIDNAWKEKEDKR